MIPGFLGYSLIFDVLILYFAYVIILPNVRAHWWLLGIGIILVFTLADWTGFRFAELLMGSVDWLFEGIARDIGIH